MELPLQNESGKKRESGSIAPRKEKSGADDSWGLADDLILYEKGKERQPYVSPGWSRAEVLRQCHDDPLAGHFGYKRMLELVRRKYSWPHMAREIKAYVAACTTCGRIKPAGHKPYGQLESLP